MTRRACPLHCCSPRRHLHNHNHQHCSDSIRVRRIITHTLSIHLHLVHKRQHHTNQYSRTNVPTINGAFSVIQVVQSDDLMICFSLLPLRASVLFISFYFFVGICWVVFQVFSTRDSKRCKGVHCVDLGERFPTNIWLQSSASIRSRTSPVKFARSPYTDPPGSVLFGRGM